MHEDEFSSKPLLFHRWVWIKTQSIQNCEIPQTLPRAPIVPIFFRIHPFYLWCPLSFPSTRKWVGGCDPVSFQWQHLNLTFPPTSDDVPLEFAWVKTVHTLQSDACTVDLVISKYVTVYPQPERGKHSWCRFPCTGQSHVVLGGKNPGWFH